MIFLVIFFNWFLEFRSYFCRHGVSSLKIGIGMHRAVAKAGANDFLVKMFDGLLGFRLAIFFALF